MTIKAPKDKMIRTRDEETKDNAPAKRQKRVRTFFVPALGKRVEAETAEEAAAKAQSIINKEVKN